MMHIRTVLAALITGLLLVVGGAGPAAAHSVYLTHGSDWGDVSSSHNSWSVEDNECDARAVILQSSPNQFATTTIVEDTNGCSAGYNSYIFGGTNPYEAGDRYVRICERDSSSILYCGSWVSL